MTKGNGSALLGRDAILSIDDLGSEYVDVPEWGGRVRIRGLSEDEQALYSSHVYGTAVDIRELDGARIGILATVGLAALTVSMGVIDENGNQVFTEADRKRLGGMSRPAIQRLHVAILKLSNMDEEATEREVKKSGADPDSNSDIASASPLE